MTSEPARRRRASGRSPIARHGRLPRHGVARGMLGLVGAALAVTLVSTLTVAGVAVASITSQIKPGIELAGEENVPDIGAIEGGVNLLLVGSDSGGGNAAYGERGQHLNDVTILLHISEDHTHATVVSFPRDLFVSIPSCPREDGDGSYSAMSSQKINTSLTYGGLACTVLTVEELTGLSIPYAALIEFDGVIQMSNAVGGVPVCVASDINDRQINFSLAAGEHVLSGFEALQFVRSRYGVGDGSDLARISNQQVFLSSLARTIKSADTLSDPVKVYGLAQAAVQNMEMSNSLQNVTTLASIALALKDIPLERVTFAQLPTYYGNSGSQSGVLLRTDDAQDLFDALIADLPVAITGSLGDGAVADPSVPVESETPAETTDPAEPSETATPGESAAPEDSGVVQLPDSITGSSAATHSCSAGQ
ncbi:LCP family protein [Salinibacterium sp. SYSU T00001]|uniref:LCP family protein n=1 Tax=Homoserinimonas sedimenticola TaxID=2986805 RepID=UPI0022369465|nr:LCP family protein [Salinibacterium sedimenticola]MCW4384846.1 LCP family protein [Salinibacterium sedimenticola]